MGNMVVITGYPVIVVVVIAEIPQAAGTTVWLLVMELFCCMMQQRTAANVRVRKDYRKIFSASKQLLA
jgi:hypothetical protein